MTMIALNAARTKIVEKGSLEARWMVDEDEAQEYLEEAAKQPKMQALMEGQEAERLADEERSAEMAAEMAAWRAAQRAARGL